MGAKPFTNPRGTRDLLGENLVLIKHLERTASMVAAVAGYQEMRTPLFEETRLFKRSLGEASDVVEKEMFSVPRRGSEGVEAMAKGFTFAPRVLRVRLELMSREASQPPHPCKNGST